MSYGGSRVVKVNLTRGPSYLAYSARTVECAATHGLPAASKMSHGPSFDAITAMAPNNPGNSNVSFIFK